MVNFIVDSTFGPTHEFASDNNIEVVNLTLTLDGKEYAEGFREDWAVFYSDYSRSKSPAKTSQPAPKLFMEAIDRVIARDPDGEIIILTIGDRLSGTIGSANIAVLQYPEHRIAAIDSHNGGVSAYILLQELVKARNDGADFDALIAKTHALRDRISTLFIPASLTELARGGRVNKLISHIGNILNIKPVFEYKANELCVRSKSLGIKRAMQAAIECCPKKFDRIAILYIGDDALVEQLKDRLFRAFGLSHIDVEPMCPVGGAHIGSGTVGIVTLESVE